MEDLDLEKAICIWENGDPIPLDLAFRLINKGFDVEALESIHMQ